MKEVVYQVKGATVDLPTLQQLRSFSSHFSSNRKKSPALTDGKHRSRHQSRGMEFEEVRIYQPGDDVRTIDWRVTARTQTPHTKCFQEEKEKPVITVVDQRASMFFGSTHCFKSVYACELCATINWASIDRGDRSGGMIMGTESIAYQPPSRTQKSMNRWLQQLSLRNNDLASLYKQQKLNAEKQLKLEDALEQLKNLSPKSAEIVIISDFYDLDKACEPLLFYLAKRHTLKFYWSFDPVEVQPPLLNQATFSNGQEEAALAINPALQKNLANLFQERRHYLEHLCQTLKIELIRVSTNTPLMEITKTTSSFGITSYG